MSARRIIAPLMTTALGLTVFATLSPASASASASASEAGSARAAVEQCQLRISKVRVKDLQHDQEGVDQVFVDIGNSLTTTRPYSVPQTRNLLGDGRELFSGTARVALRVEALQGAGSIVVGSGTVPCQNGTHDFVFDNGDATYKVRAVVDLLP